jgi:hypothetical protein
MKRNPVRSARRMAQDLGINRETVRKVLKEDLKVFPYKMQAAHHLNDKAQSTRLQRCKSLRRRFSTDATHHSILFTDEKVFTIEQSFNKQNDRIWSPSLFSIDPDHRFVRRVQKPASIMVWAGICATGKTPLVFVNPGVKVNQEYYHRHILEEVSGQTTCVAP